MSFLSCGWGEYQRKPIYGVLCGWMALFKNCNLSVFEQIISKESNLCKCGRCPETRCRWDTLGSFGVSKFEYFHSKKMMTKHTWYHSHDVHLIRGKMFLEDSFIHQDSSNTVLQTAIIHINDARKLFLFCFCFANVFPLQINCVISLSTNNTAKIKTHQILTYYSVVCKAKDLHVITWSRHKPSWEIVCVQLELTNTQTKIVSSKQVETRCAHIEIINALCRKTLRAWMNALTHKGGYTCCQMCMQIPYIPRLCLCEDLFSCSTGRINGYQCQCAS